MSQIRCPPDCAKLIDWVLMFAGFHFSAAYSPSTDPNLHDVALFMLSHEIMAVQQFFKLLKTFFYVNLMYYEVLIVQLGVTDGQWGIPKIHKRASRRQYIYHNL